MSLSTFLNRNKFHLVWFCLTLVLTIGVAKYYKARPKPDNQLKEVMAVAHAELVDSLRIYDVYDDNNQKLLFVRHGRAGDGGYVVPEIALKQADVLMGYGIADDISFEEEFSNKYDKLSYGFDCGVKTIAVKNNKCRFTSQCISSENFLYSKQNSSHSVSTFPEQLKAMEIGPKKIFLKMDIEGAEYEAFKDIYNFAPQITGIVIEIHFDTFAQELKAISLINRLKQDFYLVHVHCNNCCNPKKIFTSDNSSGHIANVLELTFINRSLVHHARISQDQSFPKSIDMPNCPQREDLHFTISNEK